MDKDRRREWLDVTRLEAGQSYRYPLVEFLTIIVLYISFSAIYPVAAMSRLMDTRPGPMWNGTSQIDAMLMYERTLATYVFSRALEQVWMALLFLAPVLLAYTTAKAFEDGSLRTILSYPVRRSHLLLMRSLLPVLLLGTVTTVSAFLALLLLVPAPLDLGALLSLTVTFWLALLLLTSSVVFLSVVTKRMVIAAIGGIALWFGLFTLSYMPDVPEIVSWVADPVHLMQQYFLGGEDSLWRFIIGASESGPPPPGDILLMLSIVGLVSVLFLVVSVLIFRRLEV
jgi:ABC-type transport system involved in multi-copper enzyme maturation permease subunit